MINTNIEILAIGDASFDVFLNPTQTETLCKVDDRQCLICFSYGDKIPVANLEFSVGGNAANHAVGVARLGTKVGIVLTLGEDGSGDQIVNKLRSEKVDLTYVIQQPATNSNYSTIINYLGERTIFTYHAPRSYEFPVQLPNAKWVYLTSMGESFRPFYNHFIEWLKKNSDIKLAFNPGSWQLKLGVDAIKEILAFSYVLYVNRQEAEKITGFGESNSKEKDLLLSLNKLGPKIPIVTDGENGAFAYDGKSFLKIGVYPVDAYERTGAGDAFGSACISALVKGKSLKEAMLWGTINSASVIGYTGAQKGLLKEEEMLEWLDRAKSSGVDVQEF